MKTNEMNVNELEQVSGGNLLDDVKDLLKKIPNPFKPDIPTQPDFPGPIVPLIPDYPMDTTVAAK